MKNIIQEARAMMECFADQRPTHLGDQLDPENARENEDLEAQGLLEDIEHAARNPGGQFEDDLERQVPRRQMQSEGTIYERIDISDKDHMLQSARQLDEDQRYAFDIIIKYVKQLRTSWRAGTARPEPPLIKIHGGAGCGKSKLIQDMSKWTEYWMSFESDKDPEKPAVVKVAPTGRAAYEIEGLTLHKAFNFGFAHDFYSLPDKLRQARQYTLSNLTLLIMDEMSMVKSDMLNLLNLRLKEVKQDKKKDFGGVSVVLSGDLMQLKPINGSWIFDPPNNPQFRQCHEAFSIWDQFKCVKLTHNHRQGKDKNYGDMLNRIRFEKHTEDDLDILKKRVTNVFPPGAQHIYGLKESVATVNRQALSGLSTSLEVFTAHNWAPHVKNYKPKPGKDGTVSDTPFLQELSIKVGARVMLTYNVDTMDGLSNGACGKVVGFGVSRDERKEVMKVNISVHFENNSMS